MMSPLCILVVLMKHSVDIAYWSPGTSRSVWCVLRCLFRFVSSQPQGFSPNYTLLFSLSQLHHVWCGCKCQPALLSSCSLTLTLCYLIITSRSLLVLSLVQSSAFVVVLQDIKNDIQGQTLRIFVSSMKMWRDFGKVFNLVLYSFIKDVDIVTVSV